MCGQPVVFVALGCDREEGALPTTHTATIGRIEFAQERYRCQQRHHQRTKPRASACAHPRST